jgi:hypothetical protein
LCYGALAINNVAEEKSLNYLELYATGVEGGPFGPYDFRMNFYQESLEKDENSKLLLKKIHKARVVMSYAAAKQLAEWINKHIEGYEEKSGQKIYIGEKE